MFFRYVLNPVCVLLEASRIHRYSDAKKTQVPNNRLQRHDPEAPNAIKLYGTYDYSNVHAHTHARIHTRAFATTPTIFEQLSVLPEAPGEFGNLRKHIVMESRWFPRYRGSLYVIVPSCYIFGTFVLLSTCLVPNAKFGTKIANSRGPMAWEVFPTAGRGSPSPSDPTIFLRTFVWNAPKIDSLTRTQY